MSVTTMSPPTAGTAGTPSDLVGQYRETLKGLLEREKALAEQAAAGEDNQLRYKRTMLREMIRDTRAALRQLAPKRGKYHASRRSSLDGALTEARLSYLAWQRRESMEHTNREELEWMRAVIDDGTAVVMKFLNLSIAQGEVPETVREHYGLLERKGSDCIRCGACERRCPFEVPVMESMKKAAEVFGK